MVDNATVAMALAVLAIGYGAWRLLGVLLAYLVATWVRVNEHAGQFKVLSFSYNNKSLETLYISVTFPPHRRKKVVRAIRLWAMVHNHYLITITVNQPLGEAIYKRYQHRLMF